MIQQFTLFLSILSLLSGQEDLSGAQKVDYYQILNVSADSTFGDIKKAFRKLAIIAHPDKLSLTLSEEEKQLKKDEFLLIQEAYDILSDPRERLVYDAKMHGVNNDFEYPPDIFTDPLAGSTVTSFIETKLFRMKVRVSIPPPEIPLIKINHPITSFKTLFYGAKDQNITYNRRKLCQVCQGTGNIHQKVPESITCPKCHGMKYSWKYLKTATDAHFNQYTYSLCDHCHGQGQVIISFTTDDTRCPQCYGIGYAYQEDFFLVEIPPNIPDHFELLVQALGHQYEYLSTAGDILITFLHAWNSTKSEWTKYSLRGTTGDVLYTHTIQDLDTFLYYDTTTARTSSTTTTAEGEVEEGYTFQFEYFTSDAMEVVVPAAITLPDLLDGYEILQEHIGLYPFQTLSAHQIGQCEYIRQRQLQASESNEAMYEEIYLDFAPSLCTIQRGHLWIKIAMNWTNVTPSQLIEQIQEEGIVIDTMHTMEEVLLAQKDGKFALSLEDFVVPIPTADTDSATAGGIFSEETVAMNADVEREVEVESAAVRAEASRSNTIQEEDDDIEDLVPSFDPSIASVAE